MRQIPQIERDLNRMEKYFETVVNPAECIRCMKIISTLQDELDQAWQQIQEEALEPDQDLSFAPDIAKIARSER